MKLYEKIRRPPFFMRATHWMTDEDRTVKAGPNARSAVIVPILLIQCGGLRRHLGRLKQVHELRRACVADAHAAKETRHG